MAEGALRRCQEGRTEMTKETGARGVSGVLEGWRGSTGSFGSSRQCSSAGRQEGWEEAERGRDVATDGSQNARLVRKSRRRRTLPDSMSTVSTQRVPCQNPSNAASNSAASLRVLSHAAATPRLVPSYKTPHVAEQSPRPSVRQTREPASTKRPFQPLANYLRGICAHRHSQRGGPERKGG